MRNSEQQPIKTNNGYVFPRRPAPSPPYLALNKAF